jgi:hypothetical protein
MKLAIVMYLQEDWKCVERLLKQLQIEAFSRLPVQGRVPGGTPGWYGESAPYRSELVMSVMPDDQAARLVGAVADCTGVEDPRHPIRAVVVNIENFVCCDNPNRR